MKKKSALFCMALSLLALSGYAGPILNDPEMWTNTPSLSGWTNALPYGTETATLGNPSEYLRITFQAHAEPPPIETDTIYTEDADLTGSFEEALLAVRFDFYAEDVLPVYSVVYFHSDVNDTEWEWAFNNSGIGGWESHNARFDYSWGWAGGTEAEFLAALASIDRIGISLQRGMDVSELNYGLDNWEYYVMIPEPATASVLASAFISIAFTFRKKLRRSRTE